MVSLERTKWNINITGDVISNIVNNYKKKILDHVNVPLSHTNDPNLNTGEVVDLVPVEDGLDMICEIKDQNVLDKIKNGLIQSVSASIDSNYYDKENGKFVGPTLLHAALVHEPYIKGMRGFVELSDSDKNQKQVIVFEDTEFDVRKTVDQIEDALSLVKEYLNKENNKEENKMENETKTTENLNTEEIKVETKTEEKVSEEKTVEENAEKQETTEAPQEENKGEDAGSTSATEEVVEATKVEGETKAEEPKVDLSEATGIYDKYLKMGKIVPAQKDAFMSLLTSKKNIELADGTTCNLQQLVTNFLDSQPKILNFDENGNDLPPDTKPEPPTDEMPAEVKDFYCNKFNMSEQDAKNAWKMAQEDDMAQREQQGSAIFK